MSRKLFLLLIVTCLMALTFNLTVQADDIKPGTERLITNNTLANIVGGEPDYFAIEGDTVVWVDQRNGYTAQRVYGVDLTDVGLNEYLIDDDGGYINKIVLSDSMAFYPITPYIASDDNYFLRLSDITDPMAIQQYDIDPNGADGYFADLDMSGSLIAFSTVDSNTAQCKVIAADISDPTTIVQHIIYSTFDSEIYDLTLDANYLCWTEWDDGEGTNVIRVADISDLAHPNIQSIILPDSASLNDLDSAGDWLVGQGQYPDWDSAGLFAVKNYWDVDNVTFLKIWDAEADATEVRYPKIDQDKVIWLYYDYGYGGGDYAGEGDVEYSALYQTNFLPAGPAPASELLKTTESDPDQLQGANISGDTILWSLDDDKLYSAELEMACGDWGYLPADLNEDCIVNLLDFAKFAESWLFCTDPTKPGCGYGVLNND
ncbi:MAG: hypothetical protein GY869_23240 [Planctomycetes bacterium]|nr:hypothetical protein [Planctomycetota bacterium]